MAAEAKRESGAISCEEMPSTLLIGGRELAPWIIRGSRNLLGVPVYIYDNIDVLGEPGKNFISLWSGGNFPFLCLSPSLNSFGKGIDSRYAGSRGNKLIVSSAVRGEKKYLQVVLADLPLLSQPDGFGQVWGLTRRWGRVGKVCSEFLLENPQGLAFIPIPPVRWERWGGVLVTETSFLLKEPRAQEALKDFLANREFKIK